MLNVCISLCGRITNQRLKSRIAEALRFGGMIALLLICPTGAARSVECTPQAIVTPHPRPGAVITDVALTRAYSDCPNARLDYRTPVTLRVGAVLYIWMRLQGDQGYLQTRESQLPISFSLARYNESVFVSHGVFGQQYISNSEAMAETVINDGLFDWRLDANKVRFDRPGEYLLTVQQGRSTICVIAAISNGCSIRFIVVGGD
jgi:hypothetical protein